MLTRKNSKRRTEQPTAKVCNMVSTNPMIGANKDYDHWKVGFWSKKVAIKMGS